MFKLRSMSEFEKLRKEVKWQYFEKLVGWVFENNNFNVETNVVKTYINTKRQYDVIAKRFNKLFIAECKKWSGRHGLSVVKKL